MNRQRVILAALLGVLALCVIYAYITMPRLEKAPPRAASQRVRPDVKVTGVPKSGGIQERINFDFLTVEPQDFPGAKRDIFRFGQKRPVRAETPVAIVEAPAPPVESVAVMPETVPFAVVQQSLGEFTFLGFLEKAGEKTVFLSSGGNLFLAKRGENFGASQEFLVADIDDNLLRVRHASRDDLLEIPLIEQQKLSASVSAPAKMPPVAAPPIQTRARTFTPKQRILRPAGSQESEEPAPELLEENAPKDDQEAQAPAEGDVLEGETNGSNQ